MGEVYRARDARLERDVALKVLPESFAREADRLARFEREAKAVASLSHPNILALFDTGTAVPDPAGSSPGSAPAVTFVVMELLTGETLGERLKAGPLPVRKATEVASLIARGLAAAHEKELVHRDLKPDNVFLTGDGQVKLLDFGLARHAEAHPAQATRSAITDAGTVMGTVGYMAPEQVRGEVVDARADLFALGAVLYEMLTGERAFRRNTNAETMTAILNEDPPDVPATRAITPALDRIVRHCLEKRPAERFQTARDVAFALDALSASSSSSSAPAVTDTPARRHPGRERMAWLAATVGLAALAGWLAFEPPGTDRPAAEAIRASIALPRGTRLAGRLVPGRRLAVSPDGRRLAFLTQPVDGEAVSLWVQSLDSDRATLVPGTRTPDAPFWSADSRHLGFFDEGKLMRMPLDGGSAFVYRVSAASGNSDIWVKPATGEPRPLVTSPFTENYAEFSPDGRWLAYVSEESGVSDVYVTSFPSGQGKWRVSPNGGTLPRWRADGRELYYVTLAGELMAAEVRAGGASFDVDVPTLLFPTRAARSPGYQYVVSADGSRFLINETLPLASTPSIDIIVNWPSLLKGARQAQE
jgi:eukaryotic-like serine/threonine-protein kinase